MKRVKLIATAMLLAVLAVLAGGAAAQETNVSERTFLTFSAPVEMPGVTLQPGTYVFKLADTPSRNVVQVWDNDEKNMIGQWLFVQAERPEVTSENVVMFKETPAGTTPAVQFWYFPGERIGKEFIYPKDQAERIARATGVDVRTESGVVEGGGLAAIQTEQPAAQASVSIENQTQTQTQGVQAEANIQAEAPAPQAQADVNAGITADANRNDTGVSASAGVTTESERAVGTSGVQAEGQVARNELPRTASPLPLSGLVGLLSLIGAFGIRAFRS